MENALCGSRQWETVNRVVFPAEDRDLTLPLYISEQGGTNAALSHNMLRFNSRRSVTLKSGTVATLCTFFNAFPAGYWRRWTGVRTVRFSCRVRGTGIVRVYKSTARGLFSSQAVMSIRQPNDFAVCNAEISIADMLDGGFLWVDIQANSESDLTFAEGEWQVDAIRKTASASSKLSVAITTFNRAPYCLRQLKTIATDFELRKRLDTVYCVDQGTDLVQDQEGFASVQAELGLQLTYIRQGNLGGSGGFSRGMLETVDAGKSQYVVLLDDDAISEPESILRATQFADYAKHPVIVGGGMLHLDNRTVLYSRGERFDSSTAMPAPAIGTEYNHDFVSHPLWSSPELHRLTYPDFNGWWLCLIPVETIRTIGLSMPFFVKYDDVEYGLRAKEHGIPTVCLPGVAVWHQGWHDKDISRTWEEYFAQRNRWICALMHFQRPCLNYAFRMMYEEAHLGVKLLYSGMKLHHMALRDVLRGPEYLQATLPKAVEEARSARKGFDDSTVYSDPDDLPPAERNFVGRQVSSSIHMQDALKAVLSAVMSRENGKSDVRPQYAMAANDAIWQNFTGVRSVMVTTVDRMGVSWLRRDSKLYRRNLHRCLRIVRTITAQWVSLSRKYRESNLGSIDNWRTIFHQ